MDIRNLDARYEGNAFCLPKGVDKEVNLKQIKIGQSITTQLFEDGLL